MSQESRTIRVEEPIDLALKERAGETGLSVHGLIRTYILRGLEADLGRTVAIPGRWGKPEDKVDAGLYVLLVRDPAPVFRFGYTKGFKLRRDRLENELGVPVETALFLPGESKTREEQLRGSFGPYRAYGEWYGPHPALVGWVNEQRRLRGLGPLEVEASMPSGAAPFGGFGPEAGSGSSLGVSPSPPSTSSSGLLPSLECSSSGSSDGGEDELLEFLGELGEGVPTLGVWLRVPRDGATGWDSSRPCGGLCEGSSGLNGNPMDSLTKNLYDNADIIHIVLRELGFTLVATKENTLSSPRLRSITFHGNESWTKWNQTR